MHVAAIRSLSILVFLGWIASIPAPAAAQSRDALPQADTSPGIVNTSAARTADTNGGRVGQRQTQEDVAKEIRIQPYARINNRIANRVQSRLRNRIDQNYDPQANAISPFIVAGEQARAGGRAR